MPTILYELNFITTSGIDNPIHFHFIIVISVPDTASTELDTTILAAAPAHKCAGSSCMPIILYELSLSCMGLIVARTQN